MWLDGILAVIFILSLVHGWRKGFIRSIAHFVGWIAAIILGFVWQDKMANFLLEHTRLYERLHTTIDVKLANPDISLDSLFENFPKILAKPLEGILDAVGEAASTGLAGLLFNIISFVLVFILVKIVIAIIASFIGKRKRRSLIGFTDGVLGLILGAVRGLIIIYILLALMVPAMSVSSGDLLKSGLDSSFIAKPLYDSNPIFRIIDNLPETLPKLMDGELELPDIELPEMPDMELPEGETPAKDLFNKLKNSKE
ncbi:MAG: CvpA family protein [Firmicutes bacterium]|nr:CvpA family protein [Bacillota bacterium]